jgi:hypothetical protein
MRVLELWRYPVKSMRGVSVQEAEIRGGEVAGDRLVQVVWTAGPRAGRVVTARTHPRLLGLAGTIDGDGRILIDGHPWDSPEAREAVRDALGSDVFEIVLYDGQGPQRFDVLPLTVVTDGVLDHIVGSLDARIALDCRALTDGTIAVGDEVRFEPG